MIQNARKKQRIQDDWSALRKIQGRLKGRSYMSPAAGAQIQESGAPDEAYNLPFVLAYAVLNQVLTLLGKEGHYPMRNRKLGEQMKDSKKHLPWQDWALAWDGKEKRDGLAHRAEVATKRKCALYVDAIEAELRAWKVL